MANAARQEVEIKFGDKTYTVKPTFEVIAAIELATGQSCGALAAKCYAGNVAGAPSLLETSQIVFQLLKPNKGPNEEDVAKILLDYGMRDLWTPLGDFLFRAVKGNREHIRQAEQEAAKEGPADPPTPASTSSDG